MLWPRGQLEIVVAKHLAEDHQDLEHGVVTADATPGGTPEGEVGEGRLEFLVRFGKALRVEAVGIFPVARGVVGSVDADDDGRAAGDRDVADDVVGYCHAIDHPERRIEAERFVNYMGGELEFRDVAEREGRVARCGIEFLPDALETLWTRAQKIEQPRECIGGSFMSGNEELHALAQDEFVGHSFAVAVAGVHQDSLGGRTIVSVNKRALALGTARMTTEVSEIDASAQIVSCGTPLAGMDVRIVNPEQHVALKPSQIGEIWIAGCGKCLGYWNNSELTLKQFRARLVDESPYDDGSLRTGDMGFLHEGELFVCGRIKDMIGFTLAAAVLIGATLVRIVIGPAVLRIAGDWNWWPGGLTAARSATVRESRE